MISGHVDLWVNEFPLEFGAETDFEVPLPRGPEKTKAERRLLDPKVSTPNLFDIKR